MEEDESLGQALLREIQEETELVVLIEQNLGEHLQRLTDITVSLNYFRCHALSKRCAPRRRLGIGLVAKKSRRL